jgi:hypothetical protein
MRDKCKLCQSETDLRQSHIIPEFCYAATYDQVGSGRARMLKSNTDRERLLQKGLRDWLLCDVCEGRLNDYYEKPFHRLWYDNPPAISATAPGRVVTLTNLNYAAFTNHPL